MRYKAIYNGIGFEQVPVDKETSDPSQRQEMFDKAMDYLIQDLQPSDNREVLLVQDNVLSRLAVLCREDH